MSSFSLLNGIVMSCNYKCSLILKNMNKFSILIAVAVISVSFFAQSVFATVQPPVLSGITITHPATKLFYTVGDPLDITGLVVTGAYTCTDIDAYDVETPSPFTTDLTSTANVSGFDNSTATSSEILTVTVGGKTATYTISVFTAPVAQSPVNLGTAGNFAILAKTAVTTTGVTSITGNVGISPAAASLTTGFGLVLDSTGCFSVSDPSSLVTGKIYAADYSTHGCTTPAVLTTAVSDMQTAYTDAAGRPHGVGPNLNIGSGTVSTQTLAPGVYTWGSDVTITGDITLSGSATDVWIFQISGTLGIDAGKQIILAGASSQNIFWQVADAVTFKPGSHFEGNILAQTNIAMQTGATLNGRALAQTAVTLDANTILASTGDIIIPVAPVIPPVPVITTSVSHGGGGFSRVIGQVLGATTSNVPATGQVLGASTFQFTTFLHQGMSGDDVVQLQERLRAEGFFTYPTSTGYFGPVTLAAVKAYQTAHNIVPASGFVGPLTIAELNSTAPATTVASVCPNGNTVASNCTSK
jgi:Ice-binding-like/Putative peptidoglycan binding domain